jgi:hypothetical protein
MLGCGCGIGATFVRLYLLPTVPNAVPEKVRLAQAW